MAPRARGAVTAWLAQERHDEVLIEVALSLVTEFVVNSVRHARITGEEQLRHDRWAVRDLQAAVAALLSRLARYGERLACAVGGDEVEVEVADQLKRRALEVLLGPDLVYGGRASS